MCAAALQREREDASKYAVGRFRQGPAVAGRQSAPGARKRCPRRRSRTSARAACCDGVAATERELLGAFERHGIKRIDPKGERFDHNFHQAIFEAERPDAPAGTVVEVLAARLCAARPAAAAGHGRRRQGRPEAGRIRLKWRGQTPRQPGRQPVVAASRLTYINPSQSQGMADYHFPGDRDGASPGRPVLL